MDISKIRKKIKEESEIRRGGKEGEQEKEKTPEIASPAQEEKPLMSDSGQAWTGEMPHDETPSPEISKKEGHSKAAKAAKPIEAVEDIVELLTFHLSAEEFAFRVSDIEEILRLQRIMMVPKVPDYILGITSLRGKIIPVIDLKTRLLINPSSSTDKARKKILILKGSKGPFGALVDKVKGVIRISPSEIVEPPAHLTEAELMFIEGVVLHNSRFISLIRMGEILDINLK